MQELDQFIVESDPTGTPPAKLDKWHDVLLTSPTALCCPLFRPSKPVTLSWPREGDRQRAMVAQVPPREAIMGIAPMYSARMIHVTDRDVARLYDLSASSPDSESSLQNVSRKGSACWQRAEWCAKGVEVVDSASDADQQHESGYG